MSEFVLVSIAWPYANSDIHQGNVTGSHLPGDIYARYHRLRGDHLRFLLAVLVLAVGVRFAVSLTFTPSDLFSLSVLQGIRP